MVGEMVCLLTKMDNNFYSPLNEENHQMLRKV